MIEATISVSIHNDNYKQNIIGGKLKRLFDIILSSSILVILSPLFIIVAVLVKLADPGPIMFCHTRVGYGGRKFQCLKFRSMVADADRLLRNRLESDPKARREWDRTQKLTNDPRITPIGKFLRQSSLDELPQLINVMRGEMSLVGPRPVAPSETKRYGDKLPLYLKARPGLTGIWQVSGRSNCVYNQRIEMDADYVTNWCFSRDVAILLRTPGAVFARRGSY
jgi:Undecaprenyl-phosphate galactose phosphotransferase WbaP